jgi:hypothetical protein
MAQHPLTGSWIANIEASRRDPNHQFQRATMRFAVDGDAVTLTYGGINASGRTEHGAQTLRADGAEHPVPEAPGINAVTTLQPAALRTEARKDSVVVGGARYEVSPDGQVMTATVSGIDAAGRRFDQVIVFDREQSP